MADILIYGDNAEFITDLQNQIQRFMSDVRLVDD